MHFTLYKLHAVPYFYMYFFYSVAIVVNIICSVILLMYVRKHSCASSAENNVKLLVEFDP